MLKETESEKTLGFFSYFIIGGISIGGLSALGPFGCAYGLQTCF